ncbi:Uncharacterized protein GBIM_05288 [Gryllus bimaculatus]|nr:Uncharacterized protein GBIM_05288 [Gryllus bimaculatus]
MYKLSRVLPPEQPVVLDHWGRQLNATVGPHDEGDDVMLTCRVIGGKPEPAVRWLVNGVLVDDEYEHNAGDVIENRLMWNTVGRQDLNSVFSCQANNTNLTEPRETSLTLDLHLKPLTVRILNKQSPLAADRRYEVQCESAGSRPPALRVGKVVYSSSDNNAHQRPAPSGIDRPPFRFSFRVSPAVPGRDLPAAPGRNIRSGRLNPGGRGRPAVDACASGTLGAREGGAPRLASCDNEDPQLTRSGRRGLRRLSDSPALKEETRENVTVSDLSFVPTTDDDGKAITCRAENPNITGAFLEASWKIDVVYPPIVSLRLGSTLTPDDIKEGDDVYFECHVKANPAWKKLRWLHNVSMPLAVECEE